MNVKMEPTDKNMLKEITVLEKETQRLEKLIASKQVENFELLVEHNRIENAIANIEAIVGKNPRQLCEVSENVCNILGACSVVTKRRKSNTLATVNNCRTSVANSFGTSKRSPVNKAHVVKPHMVNGHVLYAPIVNLTRISEPDLCTQNNASPSNQATRQENSFSQEADETDNDRTVASLSYTNALSPINEEVSEASTSQSPSHSTVLSGTFQEVKIYLNQVSEESRKSGITSRISTNSRTEKKPSVSSGVTQRKMRRRQ